MSRFTSSLLVLALVLSIAPLQIQAVSTTLAQAKAKGIQLSNGYRLYPKSFQAITPPAKAQRGLKQGLGSIGSIVNSLPLLGSLGSVAPTTLGGATAPNGQSIVMLMDVANSDGQVVATAVPLLVNSISSVTNASGRKLVQAAGACPPVNLNLNRQPVQAGNTPFMTDDINIDIQSSQGGLVGSLLCTVSSLLRLLQVDQIVFALNKILVGLNLGLI